MSTQTSTYNNPEVLGLLGFELPQMPDMNLQENLKKSVAIGGSLVALGASAVGAVVFFGKAEKANAGVEVCTTPTGEVPQPQNLPKTPGVDLMTYKPALATQLCAGSQTKVTTFIENVGTKTARSVKFSVSGISYLAKGLNTVTVDDKPIQTVDMNQYPTNGEEYCEWYEFSKDWTGRATRTLNCSYGFQRRDLDPGQKIKVEVGLIPLRTSNPTEVGGTEALYPKAPYVSFNAEDKLSADVLPDDKNLQNNGVIKQVYVRDSQGNSSQAVQATCQFPALSIKAPKVLAKRSGVLTTVIEARTKINGAGNGASKNSRVRSKAARIIVATHAKTGQLPKDMLRVGNNIFVDVPAKGVKANKSLLDRIPFRFAGNSVSFSAKFIAPRGTIASCNKAMTTVSNSLKSLSR